MRSRWWPLLGWCAATATSVALSSVALLPVLRTAAPEVAVPAPVEWLRTAEPAPAPTAAPPVPAVPPSSAAPRPASSEPASGPSSAVPAPQASTPVPPAPPVVEDGWMVTTDPDGVRSYLRTYTVDGGSAVIRMTPGRVELITATPADGYAVSTVQDTPDNLAVQFTEPGHAFVIHALWWNGAPYVDVDEIG